VERLVAGSANPIRRQAKNCVNLASAPCVLGAPRYVPLGVDGSLGFGSSSNAISWMRESAPRVGKEGNISNLSLLGGTLVTDPPASSSVVETPLVVHHP
jgi:hypothetical protein